MTPKNGFPMILTLNPQLQFDLKKGKNLGKFCQKSRLMKHYTHENSNVCSWEVNVLKGELGLFIQIFMQTCQKSASEFSPCFIG
jgi:hypothetical protein